MKNFINTKSLPLVLFIIAIVPPLILIIAENPPIPSGSDQFDFHQMAIGLLSGRGFHSNTVVAGAIKLPNARHPVYPIFITVIYFFTGKSVVAVKIAQILLHGLTCIIIFFISQDLSNNKLISFTAGSIWALYPLAISHSIILMSETLFTFLLSLSVLFILRCSKSSRLEDGIAAGLFLGLTALTRSVILPFIPVLFLWLILSYRHKLTTKIKNFSIIVLVTVLSLSPWLIRNYVVFKNPLPISTGSGLSFYRYNNEKTLDMVNTPLRIIEPLTEEEIKKLSTLPELEIDKYFYNLGRQFIKSHPKDFLKIRLTELCFFWHLWPARPKKFTEYYSQVSPKNVFLDRFKSSWFLYFCKILYHLPYNILFLGMFLGLIISFQKNREKFKKSILLFLLILTINAVYIFHHCSDRYRMPIDPYVFILGAQGIISLYNEFKTRRI